MNHKIDLKTNHKILLYWGKNAKAQGQVLIIMPTTEDLANKSAASFPPSPPTTSRQRRPLPHTVSSARQRRSHGHNLDADPPPPPPPTPSKQCSRHLSDWPVCLRLQEEPSDGVCDRCLSGTMHLVCMHMHAPSLRAADRDGCLHVRAL